MSELTAERKSAPKRAGVGTFDFISVAINQVLELLETQPFERIVDLGSASDVFLPRVASLTGLPVFAMRPPGGSQDVEPALRHIAFTEATPVQMVTRFQRPGTLFTSISTFGKMSPTEVQMLFDCIGSALTFAARGVLSGPSLERGGGGGWDHNYVDLLKGWELLELQAQPRPNLPGVETIVGTAYRR